jgi:hypothetical protein
MAAAISDWSQIAWLLDTVGAPLARKEWRQPWNFLAPTVAFLCNHGVATPHAPLPHTGKFLALSEHCASDEVEGCNGAPAQGTPRRAAPSCRVEHHGLAPILLACLLHQGNVLGALDQAADAHPLESLRRAVRQILVSALGKQRHLALDQVAPVARRGKNQAPSASIAVRATHASVMSTVLPSANSKWSASSRNSSNFLKLATARAAVPVGSLMLHSPASAARQRR